MDIQQTLSGLPAAGAYLGIAVALTLIVWVIQNLATKFDDAQEIEQENNVAFALSRAATLLAITIGMCGALSGDNNPDLAQGLLAFALEGGVLAVSTLALQFILRKALFKGLSVVDSIKHRNIAAGIIQVALGVSLGLIGFGAFSGEGGGLASGMAFFGLGALTLLVMTLIFELVSPPNYVREIANGNAPSAIIVGTYMVATAIIIQMSVSGSSQGLQVDLQNFGIWAVIGLVVNLALTWLIDLAFLTRTKKADWVSKDFTAPAILQGALHIGFALIVAMSL